MKAWIFAIFRKIWVFAKRAFTWYVCKNKSDHQSDTQNFREEGLREDDHNNSGFPSTTQKNRRRKF